MSQKTIKTLCLDGTLEGAKLIEFSGSLIKALSIPRLQFKSIEDRQEICQPAVYFLCNQTDIYVGECDNFQKRMYNHIKSRQHSFFELAISIFSKDKTYLDKAKVRYLESLAIRQVQQSGVMKVRNQQQPSIKNINEYDRPDLKQIFNETTFIMQFLGFNAFNNQLKSENPIWHLQVKQARAQGQFQAENFVLLAGSIIERDCSGTWEKNFKHRFLSRQAQLDSQPSLSDNLIKLSQNMVFKSANEATVFVLGRNANAWTNWKDGNGRTMDEIMRQ